MPTVTNTGQGTRRGIGTRSRGSLPRVASLPPRITRSRATLNSEVEPVVGPEELERALAEPIPPLEVAPATSAGGTPAPIPQQETAPGSSKEHQRLQEARDRARRPSDTFHTAVQAQDLHLLEVNEKIASMESELRVLRSEVRTLRAQPSISDLLQDVRQLRVDYNTEREANSNLKSELAALKSQQDRCGDILDLYQGRLEQVERSRTAITPTQLTLAAKPTVSTPDASRHGEGLEAIPVVKEERQTSSRSKKAKRRHNHNSSSSESSSDTEGSSSESESSSDGERKRRRKMKRHGPTGRARGKKFEGLKELKPTNSLYKELLSYRYYRLNKTSQRRTTRQTAKVSSFIKRMELSLNGHKFDGADPILVLDFLSRFVTEANVLGMSEGQAYLALPKFLRGFARDQFEAINQSAGASEGGVTSWPEAVQYLLRSYATGAAISEATAALRSVRQRAEETEIEFSTRLNIAEHRCGNVHSVEERMTYFVDGLNPAIRALVARHREAKRHLTFIELVQFAKAEGDAHRARMGLTRKVAPPGAQLRGLPSKDGKRNAALYAETLEESSTERYNSTHEEDEAALLLGEYSGRTSIPTTDLTDTESPYGTTNSSEPALAIGYSSQLPAPRIPYQRDSPYLAQRRPGWQVPRSPRGEGSPQQIVCHACYIKNDHISPKCTHPWRDVVSVARNYEALTPEERAMVPDRSYRQARTLLELNQGSPSVKRAMDSAQTSGNKPPRVLTWGDRHPQAPAAPKN